MNRRGFLAALSGLVASFMPTRGGAESVAPLPKPPIIRDDDRISDLPDIMRQDMDRAIIRAQDAQARAMIRPVVKEWGFRISSEYNIDTGQQTIYTNDGVWRTVNGEWEKLK